MIRFDCPCGKPLLVNDDLAGRTVRCPACGRDVVPVAIEQSEELEPATISRKAIFSLVLGIASFSCSFVTGIPAILLGALAIRDVSRSRNRKSGMGLAIAGIVTGSLNTLVGLSVILILRLFPPPPSP
jgi:hypothetical protein